MVLADGTVTACDQDYAGKYAVGRLSAQGIGDIRRGAAMATLRASHRTRAYDALQLCRGCDEWYRP
ncbi:MAG: SPASM domain-containing protein [Planctomycetes bacterium]|nr:SPASM domain-containing protein [Planctomycetota bacterium]